MPIVRRSASDLRKAARVDRAKLMASTDDEIDRQIAADPDLAPVMAEEQIVADIESGQAEIVAPDVDVRALRAGLGLSREQFSRRFHLPPRTVQEWEQGRRRPDQATRAYLTVIAKNPEAVAAALSGE